MKKLAAIMLSMLIITSAFAGCGKKEEAKGEEKAGEETSQSETSKDGQKNSEIDEYTDEEAKENNKKIDEKSIDLVQLKDPKSDAPIVTLKTSMGDIKIVLYPEYAPLAVQNFLTHAKEGYYNGLTFHRVIKDFVVQSGDPTGTGAGGNSVFIDENGNPTMFKDEISNNLWHFRGALSMANTGTPNSNKSQFFIVQSSTITKEDSEKMEEIKCPANVLKAYKENGGAPWLDTKHTVFGMVIEGMDIVDKIAEVEVNTDDYKPVEDVIIASVEVVNDIEYDEESEVINDAEDDVVAEDVSEDTEE